MPLPLWVVLRRNRPLVRRHLLAVADYQHLRTVLYRHLDMYEYVVLAFDQTIVKLIDTREYAFRVMRCEDRMSELRQHIREAFDTPALGHTYVINELVPTYAFLKEWYVQGYLEAYQTRVQSFAWEAPHVIVFDLDSTLITEERDVRLRDDDIPDSLLELKRMGCVLVLWSYGNREHVTHSLARTDLADYFDITLCEGSSGRSDASLERRVVVDARADLIFVKKPFFSDDATPRATDEGGDDVAKNLPKSPRVVLYYLRKFGVNFFKTITLVDDLASNDYSYDRFVHVKRCPEPRRDWSGYHDVLINNIEEHERRFDSGRRRQ
ncbi:LdOrf-99 peptide [Lymantria dispar multiple nucleopolyhedrovirus]|uniref:LdOrf-99 peptide n=1 Tax=Lymantria dispar multicapsid nuclear polyhedrosis virus TaxID=10449 RepID=Q9YMM8_NPVLD|nr:LdOrf-99 peptide [Lymantria dispar multiple nucleopolyhedrovirus]AAC70285.1 LdOrf-99 peptide [Lymantria dispar multiple nucleopolyhedrovirus]